MSVPNPINFFPIDDNEDWIKQSWDFWFNEEPVTDLLTLFRLFRHENETNQMKREFLVGFMQTKASDFMPEPMRKEVDEFFEATAEDIDYDLLGGNDRDE